IRSWRHSDSLRRDFHALARMPARLVAVGDAVAAPNPVYGQGLASAALQVSCLSEYLRSGPDLSAPARGFFALPKVLVDVLSNTPTGTPPAALPPPCPMAAAPLPAATGCCAGSTARSAPHPCSPPRSPARSRRSRGCSGIPAHWPPRRR